MKRITDTIAAEGRRIAAHPFLGRIDGVPIETLIPILAYNTGFWNMAFQDVIRLVNEAVESPELKVYSEHHFQEDSGHHIWFVNDIKALGYDWGSRLYSYFEDRNATARVLTYKILSELFRLTDDRLRIALLLSLESPGHVFFGKMSRYMAKHGISGKMQYFGKNHIKVEKEHMVFAEASDEALNGIVLEDAVAEEGIAMVVRIHELFHRLADEMCRQLEDSQWISELMTSETAPASQSAPVPPVDMSFLAQS